MTGNRLRFSLRWLFGVTTVVAILAALYACFPRTTELAFITSMFLIMPFVTVPPLLYKPIGFVCFAAFGTWLVLVAIFRRPDHWLFFIPFILASYSGAAVAFSAWLRHGRN